MNFGKYIHKLLLKNEIVIIPGLGAFVSEYKPAEISADTDEIKPPSKMILFNQQISNNDGLLVGHIAQTKKISHFDALKQIEKERENILYKLDNGEQVELDEIGFLVYNDQHAIEFKAEQDVNLLLDSFGLEGTAITVSTEIGKNKAAQDKDKNPETEKPIPAPEPQQAISRDEKEDASKKKKGWWWLLLILAPLIAVSIFVFMKDNKTGIPVEQEVQEDTISIIEKPTTVLSDTLKTDTGNIAGTNIATQGQGNEKPMPTSDTKTPKYYLVGGSFSVKQNADTYLNELKSKGLEAFYVGKKGRFFIVGIGSFDTFNQAEKAKQEYMGNNPGSEVWVYKK